MTRLKLAMLLCATVLGCAQPQPEGGELLSFDLPDGTGLRLIVDGDGKAAFELLDSDGAAHRPEPLPRGEVVVVDGSKIEYREGANTVQIGAVDGGKTIVCQDAFAAVCDLSFYQLGNERTDSYETALSIKGDAAVAFGQAGDPEAAPIVLGSSESEPAFDLADPRRYDDLKKYLIPVPYQYNAGTCLYMASTGVMELLANKAAGLTNQVPGSKYDLSERFTLNSPAAVGNAYLYSPLRLQHQNVKGGLKSADFPFTTKVTGSSVDAKINWNSTLPANWRDKLVTLPTVAAEVLFKDSRLTSGWFGKNGQMGQAHLDAVKEHVRTKGPVLFAYYPNGSWWHAVVVIGYDDDAVNGDGSKGTLYAQDSSFGAKRMDVAEHGYGTSSTVDDTQYRGITTSYLGYNKVLDFGFAATGYKLAN